MTEEGLNRVLVIGAGNIGHLAIEYIARLGGVGCLVLVDPDDFEDGNVRHACIGPRDLGRSKARVIARRLEQLKKLWPHLEVRVYACRVEEIPWGEFYLADVVVSAVDSRRVRVYIADAAYQVGRPLVDAGISADLGLVRVSVTLPSEDMPCPYCDLTGDERADVASAYSCLATPSTVPTAAPAHLGGFAAALQAERVGAITTKTLDCRYDPADPTKVATAIDDVVDLLHGSFERSIRTRNRLCSAPHEPLQAIEMWRQSPGEVTVGDLLDGPEAWFEMPGFQFSTRVVCPDGHLTRRVRPLARPRRGDRCGTCGAEATIEPTSVVDRVDRTFLPRGRRHLPLGSLGIRRLDIMRHGRGPESVLKMFADDAIAEVA